MRAPYYLIRRITFATQAIVLLGIKNCLPMGRKRISSSLLNYSRFFLGNQVSSDLLLRRLSEEKVNGIQGAVELGTDETPKLAIG